MAKMCVPVRMFCEEVITQHRKKGTAKNVADTLGYPNVAAVTNRIKSLQDRGSNIPTLPTGAGPKGRKLNIEELNAFNDSLQARLDDEELSDAA